MTVSKFPTWWDYLQVAPQPPWWWKLDLNNPGWKLSIRETLIAILHYLEAKFDYGYLINFLRDGSKILHKKSQVILTKNEGVTVIFPELWFNFESGKSMALWSWNPLLHNWQQEIYLHSSWYSEQFDTQIMSRFYIEWIILFGIKLYSF